MPRRDEQAIQRSCVEFLRRFVPPPPDGPAWAAINPVPAKSKAVAGVSKAMGLRAGVHDLVFCWQGRFIGVEIKDQKGRASDAQKAWHADLRAAGGKSYIIRDVADLAHLLRRMGVPTTARVAA